MLPLTPPQQVASGAPVRVRHLRTQTESSGCAPDSLKSSGPPLSPPQQSYVGDPVFGYRERRHSYLTSVRTIIPLPSLIVYNQKCGGAALNAPLSNRSKSFDEQDSSPAFVRLSIVRLDSLPPALQKHASLTKKRSVTLHSQKSVQQSVIGLKVEASNTA